MEGEQRRPDSGRTNVIPVETEKVDPGGTADAPTACAVGVPASGASRVVVLRALADGIDVPMDRWPGEVLKAALSRFATMLQGGGSNATLSFVTSSTAACRWPTSSREQTFPSLAMLGNYALVGRMSRSLPSASRQLMRTSRRQRSAKPKSTRRFVFGLTA